MMHPWALYKLCSFGVKLLDKLKTCLLFEGTLDF